jgi:hypothetical protein
MMEEPRFVQELRDQGKSSEAELAIYLLNLIAEMKENRQFPFFMTNGPENKIEEKHRFRWFVKKLLEILEGNGLIQVIKELPPEKKYKLLEQALTNAVAEALKDTRLRNIEETLDDLRFGQKSIKSKIFAEIAGMENEMWEEGRRIRGLIESTKEKVEQAIKKIEEADEKAEMRDYFRNRL